MGILDSLLGRWGYVRLNEFGLVRTPDGRIVMLHRRVLDDGQGGRIVGWRAEDPAPTVLEPMDLVPRTAVKQVEAARASIAMASHQVPAAVAAAAQAQRPRSSSDPSAATGSDEEEWEWQLAMARARAAAEEAERAAAKKIAKDLPTLVAVKSDSAASGPVLAVAKLTPARTPPPVPARPTPVRPQPVLVRPPPVLVPSPPVTVRAPEPTVSAPVPIDRARIARGSAVQSPRVMSEPRSGPPRTPERERTGQVERTGPVERVERPLRATESRPLPLPAPEDTTRTKAAPPATPARPAAIAAAAATRPPVAARFDSEITKTDARPALPRFSARFR